MNNNLDIKKTISKNNKKTINLDVFIILFLSFFGGLADGFSYIYRDQTFCFIQTGNIVKIVISYFNGENAIGSYILIIFLAFTIGCFIYWFILHLIKKTKINDKIFSLIVVMVLLIPSVVFKFNTKNYLALDNLISGITLSFVGSVIATAFSRIVIGKSSSFVFNSAIMTGNSKAMMVSAATFVQSKNKVKGLEALIYFVIIITFVIGIVISGIIRIDVTHQSYWDFYTNLILMYVIIVFSLAILIIKLKKDKKLKTQQQDNADRIGVQ